MSRDTEKVLRELHAFMDENADESMNEEKMNELMKQFMSQYNSRVHEEITPETAETSEDYMELCENADNLAVKLKYARKALQLDPDNLDAERTIINYSTKTIYETIPLFQNAINHGKDVMAKMGYADDVGEYWGIFPTRPFIRMYCEYAQALIDCRMMRRAADALEEIIRLNTDDNTGRRFQLMHIYAYLEDEEKALALYNRYNGHPECQLLIPLSILYYKKGEYDQAYAYLKIAMDVNKDTRRFIRGMQRDGHIEDLVDDMPYGYRPYSIEEYYTEVIENDFLFTDMDEYFEWALAMIKKKR